MNFDLQITLDQARHENLRLESDNECVVCNEKDTFKLIGLVQEHEYDNTTAVKFPVLQCTCGHVFLQPRPAVADIQKIYPQDYYSFGENKTNPDSFVSRIIEKSRISALNTRLIPFLPETKGRPFRILDVGCGDGKFLDLIKTMVPEVETFGVDASPNAVANAEIKGHKIWCGIFEEIDIPENYFDAILSYHVIEHVARPDIFLTQCRKALRPKGVLLIETPSIDTGAFKLFRSGLWGGYHAPRHWHLFGAKTFSILAENAGLRVNHCQSSPSGTFWVWTFHAITTRYFGKKFADILFPPKIIIGGGPYDFLLLAFTSLLDTLVEKLSGSGGVMWILMTRSENDAI